MYMADQSSPSSDTIRCPHCGEECRSNALACASCGQLLRNVENGDALETVQIPRDVLNNIVDDNTGIPIGTNRFSPGSVLYFSVGGVNSPITRYVREDQPLVIGREDTGELNQWDVNLSPYKGREMGVSRRHAKIILEGGNLYLEDLGSSNGTVVNGDVVTEGQRQQLRDGDEILLGRMMMWVNF